MVPVAIGLGFSVLYILTAGPSFYWLDSGELTAAAWELGIAHPPGHPLPALLGRLTCLLPVGTLSFRVTLASAFAAAVASALAALLARQVLERLFAPPTGSAGRSLPESADGGDDQREPACIEEDDSDSARPRAGSHPCAGDGSPRLPWRPPSWVIGCASAIAALCVGLSYSLWFQAVRAEVYALNLALLLGIVCLVLRWDSSGDRRPLLGAGLLAGLALCNHHFLVLLAAPAVLLFVVWRRARAGRFRLFAALATAVTLGLSPLAYLPLRAARLPEVNWGAPTTPSRFAWVVSARAFHKALDKAAAEPLSDRLAGAGFALLGGLGPAAALLAAAGIYLLWRRRRTRRIALLLTGLVGLNLLSPVLVGFDPFNPDAHGYLAVAVAFLSPGLAVLLALFAAALAAARRPGRDEPGRAPPRPRRPPWRPAAAVMCLAAALPVYQLLSSWPRCDQRRLWAPEDIGRVLLSSAPPGALVFTSYFGTLFNTWALRVTADLRPDLDVVHRNFLNQPGYSETLAERFPWLGEPARRWQKHNRLLVSDLESLASARPVLVEYDLNLDPQLAARLRPAGLLQAFGGPAPGSAAAADLAGHREVLERWRRALGDAGSLEELETRRAATWTHFLLARFACERGGSLAPLAREHLQAALDLAPDSIDLHALARTCP